MAPLTSTSTQEQAASARQAPPNCTSGVVGTTRSGQVYTSGGSRAEVDQLWTKSGSAGKGMQ